MNDIHLVTLIAPDFDYDIIDFWIKHYKALNLDSYTAFIHSEKSAKHPEVEEKLKAAGFKVAFVRGSFDDGILRYNVMNGFCVNIPEDDYILSVDSDEFQVWENNDIRKALLYGKIDVMEGYLIDCFNDKLVNAEPDLPLTIQYPKMTKHLEEQLNNLYEKKKGEKIVVAKNKFPVDFIGSHNLLTALIDDKHKGGFRVRGTINVLHYRWRGTTKERLESKNYNSEFHIETILQAFEGEPNYA